jgi:hypothetical protein
LIRDRESVLCPKLGAFFGVLSVDRRLRGDGSWMIFRLGALRISFCEDDSKLHLDGCSFRGE